MHFSLLCVFKCTLKLYACKDAFSHCFHLFNFFPPFFSSNVLSNWLLLLRHTHIDCICSNFLHCVFSKGVLKLAFQGDEKWHWLHLFDLSPLCIFKWSFKLVGLVAAWSKCVHLWAEQHKMRSQLTAQFMPFFRLIARILTFRDKKYRILMFRDKKYRILTFCDKTELYLTVLQQNNVEACSLWLSLALSGSLWLPLARSCSLRLPIALRICVQHPRSAHKALAQLAAALLRCNTLCCSGYMETYTWIYRGMRHICRGGINTWCYRCEGIRFGLR